MLGLRSSNGEGENTFEELNRLTENLIPRPKCYRLVLYQRLILLKKSFILVTYFLSCKLMYNSMYYIFGF